MTGKKAPNSHYNRKLKPLAHALRENMTKAEACLWKYVLQGRQMKGYLFRRQRPVLQYIADFMCPELKLIVEVDGISHDLEEDQEKDEMRDSALNSAGYRVLRVLNDDVLKRLDDVRARIEEAIEEIEESTPESADADSPPPAGDTRPETLIT